MNKYLKYILHAAILVGLVMAGFKYLRGEEIWEALRSFRYAYAPFILGLSALYLFLQSWRFGFLLKPLADVPWNLAIRLYAAGQAATLVPGGVAARAGMLKQVGVPIAKSAVPVAFSSILNMAVLVGASLVAGVFVQSARTPALILLGVVVALAAALLIPAARQGLLNVIQWGAGKLDKEEELETFLDALEDVVTVRLMLITLGITLVAIAAKVFILDLVLRGTGNPLGYATLILAYVLPTMLGRLSGLPAGGIGVTEASMIGFLAAGGVGTGVATAAVALYRIATVFFQALLGAIIYALAWNGEDETQAKNTGEDAKADKSMSPEAN